MSSWQTTFYNTKVKPFLKYEQEAAKRINKLFNVEILNFNNDNKYDFIDSNNIKYEVKYDGYSIKSGNFFIEYKGYGKPSGISTTEAQYYIITDGNNYYMICTKKLKGLCAQYGVTRCTKDGLTFAHIINSNIIVGNSQLI